MIVYQATKAEFQTIAHDSDLGEVIHTAFRKATGRSVGKAEVDSWTASLMRMSNVLNDPDIPADAGVGIEFHVPPLRRRIDFLLSGTDASGGSRVAIVELKQWSEARKSDKEDLVFTHFRSGEGEVPHPSYQAWSYAELMRGYCEPVSSGAISVHPCAYLHNYPEKGDLHDGHYAKHLALAPMFTKGEQEKLRLRAFLKSHVAKGDGGTALFDIVNGRVRPSKALADSVVSMLAGNPEFVLLDDQKVVFETTRATWAEGRLPNTKNVLVIDGGPGTGKSVVAINLLVDALKHGLNAGYVTKNAAPRAVFEHRLAKSGRRDRSRLQGLFHGSGEFTESPVDGYDVLIVDEAHRLREKSGLYGNLGEHQITEILRASRVVVFLIDERQRVTLSDIGSKQEIQRQSIGVNAPVRHLKLEGQFRCAGSDAFMAWVEKAVDLPGRELGAVAIAESMDKYGSGVSVESNEPYDLRVFDSPTAMKAEIERLDADHGARMVAGYCWNWVSKRTPSAYDIELPEHGFRMRWNLTRDGSLWMVAPDAVNEIGCIHTSQGLEVGYIGVILGPDLVIRDGVVQTDYNGRARTDISLKGIKKLAKTNPELARRRADEIIKNTYFTLMSRGMRGCFLYSTDAETQAWLKESVTEFRAENRADSVS